MRKTIKSYSVILVAFILCLSLVASSGAASIPRGPIEVVFWHSLSGATGEALESIINKYNATRGAEKDISVTLVFQGFEGTDKVVLAYQTRDTVNAPDINIGLTSTIPSISDLDWAVSLDDYLNDSANSVSRDTFPPALQRSVTYMGRVWGIPFANSVPLLYYDADALREAGFDRAPETFDELIQYTAALLQRDSAGNVARYGVNFQARRYHMVQFIVSQNPDSFFGDYEGGRAAPMTRVVAGEDGTMRNYLEKMQRLVETGGYKYTEDNINEEFAQGLSAMVIMSSSRLGTVKNLVGDSFDWQTAFIPRVNLGDNGGAAVGGSCLNFFNRGDKARVDAAWDVAEFLLQPENMAMFSQVSGFLPVTNASANSPDMKKFYEENPQFKVALDQMFAAHPNAQEPLDLVMNDVQRVITNTMLEFCEGKLSVDAAVETVVTDINKALDEYHIANR